MMPNTTRPHSHTSRASRTHAPSIFSYAFFRPMSSQQLQARRGARADTLDPPVGHIDKALRIPSNTDICSNGLDQPIHAEKSDINGSLSLARSPETELNRDDKKAGYIAAFEVNAGHPIAGRNWPHPHLASQNVHHPLDSNMNTGLGGIRGPRADEYTDQDSHGFFESPRIISQRQTQSVLQVKEETFFGQVLVPSNEEKAPLGKNYQYFLGNTIFCWGGKMQNTRELPINAATGALVVIPCVLFLIHS